MHSTLVTVWLLYLAAMVSPGPNVLLVSQLAASAGRRSAWLAGLGVAFGAGVWASCAVLGVHAFFLAFPRLRLALQLLGALYLLYIAIRLWRSGGAASGPAAPAPGSWAAFRAGALTNLTNPKAALFFGSIFATSFPAHPIVALQVGAVTRRYARVSALLGRVASACFGAIGLGMLLGTLREARSRLCERGA